MSDSKQRIGFIGAGLMGHGAAKNMMEKGGYPLVTMAHRNRAPIDDLVKRGATEVTLPQEVAAQSDIVFLCLTGTETVREVVFGEGGVVNGLRDGMIIVDTTTTIPEASIEFAKALGEKGVTFLDAPLGRSPKEAEEGRLGCYIGGPDDVVAELEPIIACFAENIVHTGPVGSAGTCKILNNFITLSNCAVIAEAVATARHIGVDLETFYKVVSSSGANSRMFQQMMPWALEGDPSRLKGHLATAMKDVSYYNKLSHDAEVTSFLGSTVYEIYRYANARGYGRSFVPRLAGIIAEINGDEIHPIVADD
ncbi:MAG: NAD(P)-dependent oxidoreductase [Hyphomicrobiales bacterium]|nr:NAD(P)-dependent oxidoreductase [Hyphomicrobiales bacterium]